MTDYLLLKTNGIPAGGNAGQVLQKQSNQDYDVDWVDNDSTGFLKFKKLAPDTSIGPNYYIPVSPDTAGAVDPYFVATDATDFPPDPGDGTSIALAVNMNPGVPWVDVYVSDGSWGNIWTSYPVEDGWLFHETYDGKEKYFIGEVVKNLDFNIPSNVVTSDDVDVLIIETTEAAALATSTANPKAIVFYPI